MNNRIDPPVLRGGEKTLLGADGSTISASGSPDEHRRFISIFRTTTAPYRIVYRAVVTIRTCLAGCAPGVVDEMSVINVACPSSRFGYRRHPAHVPTTGP